MAIPISQIVDAIWARSPRTVDGQVPAASNGSLNDDIAYAIWTYPSRTVEGGSTNYPVSIDEATSLASSQSALSNLNRSHSEPAAAADSSSCVLTTAVSQTEVTTANTSQSVSSSFITSQIEATSAADTSNAGIVLLSVENTTASDSSSVLLRAQASRTEGTTAADSSTGLLGTSASRVEATTASDSESAVSNLVISHVEATTASDARSALASFLVSRTEAASAASFEDGATQGNQTGSVIEATTASDSSTIRFPQAHAESNTASDTTSVRFPAVAGEENTAAESSVTSISYSKPHAETTLAADSSTVILIYKTSQVEAANASDLNSLGTQTSHIEANLTTDTIPTPQYLLPVNEAASAASSQTAVLRINVTPLEVSNASDATIVSTRHSHIEAVTASDSTNITIRISQVENTTAQSSQPASQTFRVSSDNAAAAQDLPSSQSFFIIYHADASVSVDYPQVTYVLKTSEIETFFLGDMLEDAASLHKKLNTSSSFFDIASFAGIFCRDIVSGETITFRDRVSPIAAVSSRKIVKRALLDTASGSLQRTRGVYLTPVGISSKLADSWTVQDAIVSVRRTLTRLIEDSEEMSELQQERLQLNRKLSTSVASTAGASLPKRIVANISTAVGYQDEPN